MEESGAGHGHPLDRLAEGRRRGGRREALAALLRGPDPAGPRPAPGCALRRRRRGGRGPQRLRQLLPGRGPRRYPGSTTATTSGGLLVVITERKALDQAQRERRQKRGGGKILGTPDLPDADGRAGGLAGVASPEPTPEFAAQVADECGRLLGKLRDDGLRQAAQLKMEGYTNEEVAERLGCSLRSVARKLELIRRTWEDEEGAGP